MAAADKGHLTVVQMLHQAGAEIHAKDNVSCALVMRWGCFWEIHSMQGQVPMGTRWKRSESGLASLPWQCGKRAKRYRQANGGNEESNEHCPGQSKPLRILRIMFFRCIVALALTLCRPARRARALTVLSTCISCFSAFFSLLSFGAQDGCTALMLAAGNGHLAVVQWLQHAAVDVHAKSKVSFGLLW
jgi:hypothetical protein